MPSKRDLSRYLQRDEVLTSQELIQRLCQSGYTESNARQAIRRLANDGNVWRSSNLKLPRNARLFALAEFREKREFVRAASEKLKNCKRNGLSRCLAVLARRKILNKIDVARLLAVTPEFRGDVPSLSSRSYASEFAALKELGLESINHDTSLGSIRFRGKMRSVEVSPSMALDGLRREAILSRILIDRMRQQNQIAWNQYEVPDLSSPFTLFNNQLFTAFGFSYLSPLVRWRSSASTPAPCPVVIDCYHDRCSLEQIESLVQRVERATCRGKSRQRILVVVGAYEFDQQAWSYAKRIGYMTVNFRQQFGDDALAVMTQVEELLQSLTSEETDGRSASHFDSIASMLADLKSNPIVSSLRAIAFEAMAGLALRSDGYERVEMGRVVPWEKTTRDVDVYGIRGDCVRIIECKACHQRKSVSTEEVRKFFTQTVPALKKSLRSQGREFKRYEAEIWTTGKKGKEAGDELYKLSHTAKDEWRICRIKEIKEILPEPIKKRCLELLEAIALAATDGALPDNDFDSAESTLL